MGARRTISAGLAVLAWTAATVTMMAGQASAAPVNAPAPPAGITCVGSQALGQGAPYTILVAGNMAQTSAEVLGRIAVGGNAVLDGLGIIPPGQAGGRKVGLTVGGALSFKNGQLSVGDITYGKEFSGTVSTPDGQARRAPLALNLKSVFASITAQTKAWSAMGSNGKVNQTDQETIELDGVDQRLNVFQLQADQLQRARVLRIKVPLGSPAPTTIISVNGAAYTSPSAPATKLEFWSGTGFAEFGDPAPSPQLEQIRAGLVWSFPTATSVQVGPNVGWQGSILAPAATLRFRSGQINGTVAAAALTGTTSSYRHLFGGSCLPLVKAGTKLPVLTPATAATPIGNTAGKSAAATKPKSSSNMALLLVAGALLLIGIVLAIVFAGRQARKRQNAAPAGRRPSHQLDADGQDPTYRDGYPAQGAQYQQGYGQSDSGFGQQDGYPQQGSVYGPAGPEYGQQGGSHSQPDGGSYRQPGDTPGHRGGRHR